WRFRLTWWEKELRRTCRLGSNCGARANTLFCLPDGRRLSPLAGATARGSVAPGRLVEAGGIQQRGNCRQARLYRANSRAQAGQDTPHLGESRCVMPDQFNDHNTLTEEEEACLDRACDAFEMAWKTGQRPSIQEVLAAAPAGEALRTRLLRE